MTRLLGTLMLAICLGVLSRAHAQYPSKPIKLIVPVPPGGPSDSAARTLGQSLTQSLGQPIVVENRPGADGTIAAQAALGSPSDGYTLLWGLASMVAIPLLHEPSPFKSLTDFTPVSIVCRLPFGMVVHPSVPTKSVGEFVAYARANPDKLSFATGPLSEFMAAVQFMKATGISMVRVPYKGGAQAIPDLIEGRVEVYFTPLSLSLPHARSGRLRMLATMLPRRSALAPDVPTMTEAGVTGISVPNWNAILLPPKTSSEISKRISDELQRILRQPDLRAAYDSQGLQAEGSTREEAAAVIAADFETWRRFIRENNIPQE